MKSLASTAFGIVSSIGFIIMLMIGASLVIDHAEARNAPLSATASALWTDQPKIIDVARQKLQREAPIYSTYAIAQQRRELASTNSTGSKPAANAAASQVSQNANEAADLSSAAVAWCANRYRSYDTATNTYRDFAGQIRACTPPESHVASDGVEKADSAATDGFHMTWCEQHYRSFDPATNTYRTYGGEIRTCISPAPGSDIASN